MLNMNDKNIQGAFNGLARLASGGNVLAGKWMANASQWPNDHPGAHPPGGFISHLQHGNTKTHQSDGTPVELFYDTGGIDDL